MTDMAQRLARYVFGPVLVSAVCLGGVVAVPPSAGAVPRLSTPPGPVLDGSTIPDRASSSQRKLSPQLAAAADHGLAPSTAAPSRWAVPTSGAGSLQVDRRGAVAATVRVSPVSESLTAAVRATGATVTNVSATYSTLSVRGTPAQLEAIGRIAGVQYIREAPAPLTSADRTGSGAVSATPVPPAAPVAPKAPAGCPSGGIVSEGVPAISADYARASYGISGAGVKVGIISDSFDASPSGVLTHQADDILSGDLPGPSNPCGHLTSTHVLAEDYGGTDEGRAMAQIVHDVAPGAGLAFASSGDTQFTMASSIGALQADGAGVIVDDVVYLDEPMFQDGPVAVAATIASNAGIPYVTSVGNFGAGFPGSVGLADYVPSPCRITPPPPYVDCERLYGGAGLQVAPGATVVLDLQWTQPMFWVTTDYDLLLFDGYTGDYIAGGLIFNTASQTPFEMVAIRNNLPMYGSLIVMVARYSGPPTKFAALNLSSGSSVSYPTGSTGVIGHAASAGTVSVGAVGNPSYNTLEPYSSSGATTHLFAPAVGGTPAAPIASVTLVDPDTVAPDNVSNTFFGPYLGSYPHFSGTSASAPHVAGVLALLREQRPSSSVAQLVSQVLSTGSPLPSWPQLYLVNARAAADAAVNPRPPGQPDVSFGNRGRITVQLDASAPSFVAGDAGGRIVVGTGTSATSGVSVVRRYLPDGSADWLFGTFGVVGIGSLDARAALLRLDGTTIVGGRDAGTSQPRLVALTTSGAIDTTFGVGGSVTLPGAGLSSVHAVIALAERGGRIAVLEDSSVIALVDGATGALISTFGSGGEVAGSIGDNLVQLSLDSVGRVVALGTDLIRRLPTGALDSSFGVAGHRNVVGASDLALRSDDRPVVTGSGPPAVTVLTTAGALDTTYGTGGVATPTVACAGYTGPSTSFVEADDSTIVLVGCNGNALTQRLTTTGQIDPSYGPGGSNVMPALSGMAFYKARPVAAVGNRVVADLTGSSAGIHELMAVIGEPGSLAPLPWPPIPVDVVGGQIERLYRGALGRRPDYLSLVGWERIRFSGQSLLALANAFISAPEFAIRYGTNVSDVQFIANLYWNVLGRAPDPAGLALWVSWLSSGALTRPYVVIGFTESAEFVANTGTKYQNVTDGQITRLYTAYFLRDPDPAGFAGWTTVLRSGVSLYWVSQGFASSVEFTLLYGSLSDVQFVTLAYQNALVRAPDTAGLNYWVGELAAGRLNRGGVMLGISESPEFIFRSGTSTPW